MMNDLLIEFVQQLLQEKLRNKKFDFEKLDGFVSQVKMVDYARTVGLEEIGHGSDRATFILNSSKVLKIAKNSGRALAQNKVECEIADLPIAKQWVTRVFVYDHKYRWLVSEIVRPVTDDEYIEKFGIDPLTFVDLAEKIDWVEPSTDGDLQKLITELTPKQLELATQFAEFLSETGLHPGEFEVIEHWGKTADGRIVILDSGYEF